MCDPTIVLRHYHNACASNNLSLTDSIESMETNSIRDLYSDFRSPSRGQRQHLRKRQLVLNPIFHRSPRLRDCSCSSRRAISNRQRHLKRAQTECTDEAYWDKECAELEHRQRTESLGIVALYYSHGHNAEVIEDLRPKPLSLEEKYEETLSLGTQKGVATSNNPTAWTETQTITTTHWTLTLSAPSTSSPASTSQDPDQPILPAQQDESFAYHLNASGLWELGRGPRYTTQPSPTVPPDPYGCTTHPITLSCGCYCLPCSCASFPSWWRSPEEDWRGSIVGLMSGGVYEAMEFADALHEWDFYSSSVGREDVTLGSEAGGKVRYDWGADAGDWTIVCTTRGRRDEEWDLVSTLSSTGSWRVVAVK